MHSLNRNIILVCNSCDYGVSCRVQLDENCFYFICWITFHPQEFQSAAIEKRQTFRFFCGFSKIKVRREM